MDKIEKIPIPEDVKRVLDNISHILIGLNYKETARDYKQAVEKLISLSEVEEPDKGLEKASYDAVCRVFGCDPMYFGNKAEITARECDYLFRAGVEWRDSQLPKLPDKSLEDAIMEYYGNIPDDKDKVDAAHHFAQWGAEHLHDTTKMIDKSLEEAAEEKYPVYWKSYPKDGIVRSESSYDTNKQCRDAFIAGAEWQEEQDQPITGNSLEQEWLRYVDKKKKEYGGELPSLGEYGWLQIARHFAEWQASQMPMPEDTVLFNKGVAEGRRLEREDMTIDAEECELYWDGDFLAIDLNMRALGYSERDKVKVIVLKEEEE